jgi:hypothetical protein
VGGWIVFAKIGFRFDDAADERLARKLADNEFAEKISCHPVRRLQV